jgi:hypothetical protein
MIGFMFDLFKKQDEVATGRNIKEMDLSPLDSAAIFCGLQSYRPEALSAFGANR